MWIRTKMASATTEPLQKLRKMLAAEIILIKIMTESATTGKHPIIHKPLKDAVLSIITMMASVIIEKATIKGIVAEKDMAMDVSTDTDGETAINNNDKIRKDFLNTNFYKIKL
jgi:hypothetical protein